MYIQITKRHPVNGNKFITICDYGYFRKKGEWELISIKIWKYDILIYRYKKYKNEWPVNCG